ncbi:MAG: Major facilitator superfamily, partial [Microgenomates group bacterium GW2011_GWA2_47_8]
SGFFYSIFTLGSGAGVLFLGFLIAKFHYEIPLLWYSFLPLAGFLFLTGLTDLKVKQQTSQFKLAAKFLTNIIPLRLSIFYFAFSFINGLVFGIIPIDIKNLLGIKYVGVLSSIIFMMPIFFSFFFGRFSDIRGRKATIILSYIILTLGLMSMYFRERPLLLILGIFLLAINRAVIAPTIFALIGDVSTEKNIEAHTALLWMAQNIGVVSALIFSGKVQTKPIYLISIAIIVISLVILLPVLKLDFKAIKLKLSQE